MCRETTTAWWAIAASSSRESQRSGSGVLAPGLRGFEALRAREIAGTPSPAARRQPDYRSSGPKRLMPQLQIKVPSLRRWGKKMAVVVDRRFFEAMGMHRMETVRHVSNCDVAWFVVDYKEEKGKARLIRHRVYFTTLERSVEGLRAGIPTDLATFEERIEAKFQKLRKAGSTP